MDDSLLFNLISTAILLLTIFFGYYFRNRIRPIALVQNQMDIIEQFQQNMVERQPLNTLNLQSYSNPFNVTLLSSNSSINGLKKKPGRDVFFTKRLNKNSNFFSEGIRFKVQVTDQGLAANESQPIHLIVAWAVQIDKFYPELERPIQETFYPIGVQSPFLKPISVHVDHEVVIGLKDQKEFSYRVPDGACEEMFRQLESEQSVRNIYHVVVAVFRDSTDLSSLSPNDIVANVNIYHLKDSKMSSKHIQNLVKFKNGRVANINRIFVEDENLCVVCQVNQAVQVLLPCSHKCVCSECIHRLNRKCPLCRSPINNKFEVS